MVVEVRSTFKVGVPNRSNPPHFYGVVPLRRELMVKNVRSADGEIPVKRNNTEALNLK